MGKSCSSTHLPCRLAARPQRPCGALSGEGLPSPDEVPVPGGTRLGLLFAPCWLFLWVRSHLVLKAWLESSRFE